MIEKALRKKLRPIVNRRRRLSLAWRLSSYWAIAGLAASALLGVYWLWGWTSTTATTALCIATALATIWALYKSYRIQPDYRAAARTIERQYPEARAMLLAAAEQEPHDPHGQLGYLQESVIGDALVHAIDHNWLRSISPKKLLLANLGCIAVLCFFLLVLLQILPSTSYSFAIGGRLLARRSYQITVSPGDATVESGTPLVILARFDEIVPPEAKLLIGPTDMEKQEIVLTKNLNDPVFGGIIPEVTGNLLYHIEYAARRTRDYKITTFEYPLLQSADANIVYPSYTKLGKKLIKDTRRISVVEGSRVTLTFTLNKPVATAQLTAKDQSVLNLNADDEYANIYTTTINATANRRYELHLNDAQGRANKIPPRFVIEVHKNLPAQLKALFPNRDVQASALEELSLEAEVLDDYGLIAYGLSYTLAGTQSVDIELGQSPMLSKNKQNIEYVLALEELNAQPDQLLTYYFWADDVGTDGKIRRTSSDMYFTEIRHFEEIFRESQSSQRQNNQNRQQNQQGQQADQLARLQKQIISATWNLKRQADQAGRVDDNNDLDVIRRSQSDALRQAQSALAETQDPPSAEALQTATKHMETSLDHLTEATESASAEHLTPALAAEQSAYQELLKLRRREHQVGRNQSSSRSRSSASARSEQQLQQLELRQKKDRYETERLAQSQQQTEQREDLQALNRLRELARRQNEMSNKLKELEAALRQAQTEQQKQEIVRELKRLREEQLASLQDVDELQQRMERPENRRRTADAREQLTQSRSRIRQSAEELKQGMVSRAITLTTRAGRELEQIRDDFRRRTSRQFTEQMRNMRQRAQQLDKRQKEIADEMKQQAESKQKLLTDSGVNNELAERMDQQKTKTEELIDQMKNVGQEAETSEPLLSKKLYDTLRKASMDNVDKALEVAGELLRRDFLPQAREVARQADKGIEEIRKGVEEAAGSILGDEAESLRLARRQLDELIREVDDEIAGASGAGRRRSDDPNQSTAPAANQQRRSDARTGRTGGQRPGDSNEPTDAAANQQRLADAQSGRSGQRRDGQSRTSQERRASENASQGRNASANSSGQPGSQLNRTQSPDGRNARADTGARNNPTGRGGGERLFDQWGGINTTGPLTGRDFRQWSDRMRDVEEMLTRADQRNEVARVRDRARAMRAEFKRHGKEPQWDLVAQQIIKPLTELRKLLSDQLAQLQSDEALVPIDRDPVPGRFTELVRRYYESLGGGN